MKFDTYEVSHRLNTFWSFFIRINGSFRRFFFNKNIFTNFGKILKNVNRNDQIFLMTVFKTQLQILNNITISQVFLKLRII